MKKVLVTLCVVLITNILAINLKAQQEIIFSLKLNIVNNDYSFYDSTVLKTLNFKVQNLSSEKKNEWIEITKKSKIVEKMDFLYEKDAEQRGQLVFYKPTSILMLKQYIEELGLNVIYVYGKKVLTKTIIPISEVRSKAAGFKNKQNTFTTECNDTTKIEYYNFHINYAESKLQLMWEGNYPKYLFEGYISEYIELLEKTTLKRELFLKKSNNK